MDASTSQVDVEKLISFGNDLISVLSKSKDTDILMQSVGLTQSLRSFCEQESLDVHKSLEGYTQRINDYKQKIADVEKLTIDNTELKLLQSELQGELQQEASLRQELRKLQDEMDDLECRRISLEDRNAAVKRKEKEFLKSQACLLNDDNPSKVIGKVTTNYSFENSLAHAADYWKTLSMCASVTRIIPDLGDGTKISGYIVDRDKKKFEKFEYNSPPPSAPMEICNDLWNKIGQ